MNLRPDGDPEVWACVIGIQGYKISNKGSVSKDFGPYPKKLTQRSRNNHYLFVTITINGKRTPKDVHRLTALAFHPNPQRKPQVDHINGDMFNNHASNLRWATAQENRANIESKRTPEIRVATLEKQLIKRAQEPDKPMTDAFYERDPKIPGLHRKGKGWFLYYRTKGKKERRPKIGSLDVMSRQQARKIAVEWLIEVAKGGDPYDRINNAPEIRTVADLRRRFDEVHASRKKPSTREAYTRLWDLYVMPKLAAKDVTRITAADMSDLHHAMRATPYQANRVMAMLHKAFELAKTWGWVTGDNPVRVERYQEHKRRRVLSNAELERLFAALQDLRQAQPWFVAMVELLTFTGCRLREIQQARWEWVRDGALHLPDSKTGAKAVPLNQPARDALAAVPRIVGNPYIICGRGRSHLQGHFKHWRTVLAKAGITGVRIHDLRRTFVSISLSAGVPLDQVGQVVGHASIVTTRGYAYLATDAAQRAADLTGQQFIKISRPSKT